jgi:hypothetical protein
LHELVLNQKPMHKERRPIQDAGDLPRSCYGAVENFYQIMKVTLQHRPTLNRSLLGMASIAAVACLTGAFSQPAKAAPLSGNALDVIFSAGPPPSVNNGTPVGTIDSTTGAQGFEVIFDASNPAGGAFIDISKFFSLQAASIKTGTGGGTISFKDVQFFVSGTTNGSFPFGGAQTITDTSIAVWQPTPVEQSQGFANYSVNGPVSTSFGSGTNYRTASFNLTPLGSPNPITGLDAGQINTLAFQPSAFGISAITQLKIKGLITGSSADGAAAAFGLALFNADPSTSPGAPIAIAGRAVNVNAFTTPTPGPLPLLGGGAAFGMSRRLRRRIGASKVAA